MGEGAEAVRSVGGESATEEGANEDEPFERRNGSLGAKSSFSFFISTLRHTF